MEKKSLEVLQSSLRNVLFDDWSLSLKRKLNRIVSLSNYYNSEYNNPQIIGELIKLNSNLLNYELLDDLTDILRRFHEKDFHWNPGINYDKITENINLSPTFNMEFKDISMIINEIEKIRSDINNQPVNLNILISFISKRAKEEGDLDKLDGKADGVLIDGK
jgi:hypothetical protein